MRPYLMSILLLTLSATGAFGDRPNCRVRVDVLFEDGRKKIDISELHVSTREQCKLEAHERGILSDSHSAEKVKVFFGFRDPAIVTDRD